jgi:hypothetical protein
MTSFQEKCDWRLYSFLQSLADSTVIKTFRNESKYKLLSSLSTSKKNWIDNNNINRRE